MRVTPLVVLVTLLGSSAVLGQDVFVPDGNATTGACFVIPFGSSKRGPWSNQRYQSMITAKELGPPGKSGGRICDIAFAPCGTRSFVRHFDTIEIVLGQTHASTLSKTFAKNLVTHVQTVLRRTGYDWHQVGGRWNSVDLDRAYDYVPARGNLVVQITVTGAHHRTPGTDGMHTASVRPRLKGRVAANGWTSTPPAVGFPAITGGLKMKLFFGTSDLHEFGFGCRGSNGVPSLTLGGSARLGAAFSIRLANAPASTVALLTFSVTRLEPTLDLAPLGAPGCVLYVAPDARLALRTDRSGTGTLSQIAVPNDARLICLRFYTQFLVFDRRANTAGMTASNGARVLLGR